MNLLYAISNHIGSITIIVDFSKQALVPFPSMFHIPTHKFQLKDRPNSLFTQHGQWKYFHLLSDDLPHCDLKDCVYFLSLNIIFLVMAIVTWQSQHINTEGIDFISNRICVKQFLNHSTSLPANSTTINSDSNMHLATMVCLAMFNQFHPYQG